MTAARSSTLLLLALALPACKLGDPPVDPPVLHPPTAATSASSAPVAAAASAAAPADTDDPAEIARRLEEKYQKGELPTGATTMRVTGQMIHLKGDKVVATETAPPALHGHGEALRDIWVTSDGAVFASGYMYTGVPGPDTGAVYRRSPTGAWEIVYSKRENEFGTLWGTSSSDLYISGVKTVAHFDGKAWSELSIPMLDGNVQGVWGKGEDLWVTGGPLFAKQDAGRIYHRGKGGTWTLESKAPGYLYAISGVGSSVWAVGDRGSILRRGKDGHWKPESGGGKSQHTSVWASAENDVYVAGSELLHSTGDGQFTRVDLPIKSQVTDVWGRGKDDVYIGTMSGVYHLQGGTWKKTGYDSDIGGISGTADEIWLTHDSMRESR